MGFKWYQTQFKGLRYREHPTRKNGSVKKDVCYQIRFLLDSKRYEETLGWATEGWTLEKAALKLGELREAQRTGEGERTLSEKRKKAEEERKEKERQEKIKEKESITFGAVFEGHYWPHAQSYKTRRTLTTERSMYDLWMKSLLADKRMKDVNPFHIERIRKQIRDAGRSQRTQHTALQIVRQVFNFAIGSELYVGPNPATLWQKQSKLKGKEKVRDNKRIRFLSRTEAENLLKELSNVSEFTHDQALLSLHTGMRYGEIACLTWQDVDFDNDIIVVKDTKNGLTRNTFLTQATASMLKRRKEADTLNHLVFPNRLGEIQFEVSHSFNRTVKKLGLNDGIEDRRQKVVFHTLRHTFASWLVQQGTDLYTVKTLLGHKSLAMTERYAHLAPEGVRSAVRQLDKNLSHVAAKVVEFRTNQ